MDLGHGVQFLLVTICLWFFASLINLQIELLNMQFLTQGHGQDEAFIFDIPRTQDSWAIDTIGFHPEYGFMILEPIIVSTIKILYIYIYFLNVFIDIITKQCFTVA